MPFARAYSPALQQYGVSLSEFVKFIDDLNIVSTASPPLQLLGVAGEFVGMVPHHIPQLVGNALSLSAKAGTMVVSKTRTSAFLDAANRELFAPRGLKVQLATTKVLKARLGLSPEMKLVPAADNTTPQSFQTRAMHALEGFVAPLDFDMPPAEQSVATLDRISASTLR